VLRDPFADEEAALIAKRDTRPKEVRVLPIGGAAHIHLVAARARRVVERLAANEHFLRGQRPGVLCIATTSSTGRGIAAASALSRRTGRRSRTPAAGRRRLTLWGGGGCRLATLCDHEASRPCGRQQDGRARASDGNHWLNTPPPGTGRRAPGRTSSPSCVRVGIRQPGRSCYWICPVPIVPRTGRRPCASRGWTSSRRAP
jgi:hypothetical protein